MDNRTLDKRKAREKGGDEDESSESVNNSKNPTKRARVDYSSSSSPKEKSPSPASAQRSPMLGKSTVTDSYAAATPDPSMDQETLDRGISSAKSSVISKPKFDLPSPLTVQELEQKIGKSEGTDDGDDSDNESTKFLTGIVESEEKKRKRQTKGKASGTDSSEQNGGVHASSPKRNSSSGKLGNSSGKQYQPAMSSSPLELSTSDFSISVGEVEVYIKVTHPETQHVFLEQTVRSDFSKVDEFFQKHNLKLSTSSSQGSGYLGDISSLESVQGSSKMINRTSNSNKNRWTTSSLGSTIPRQSIVSISTDTSDSPDDLNLKRPGRPAPVSKARKHSDGPIMSSSKMNEATGGSNTDFLDRMNVSSNSLTNGDDHDSPSKSQSPKKGRGAPKSLTRDEGLGSTGQISTPKGGARRNSKSKGTSTPGPSSLLNNSSTDSGVEKSAKKPGARRRGGSANNFPITSPVVQPELSRVLNTPPPTRSVAKIEGTSAKPSSKFEQELNNEPVNEKELQKSETLCSSILLDEPVFARWRDKSYYSGMVKQKSLNDTWRIDFDDGMEDVASETHIIPIRILGVGVKGIYSPDEKYEAKEAEIIGQKFCKDPDNPTGTAVKYAIKCKGMEKPIWCSRRQLSLTEIEARRIRPELPATLTGGKAGDVSLDNIVAGPRRRTRGGTEITPKSQLADAGFDSSSTGETMNVTPKSRGGRVNKKTPASASAGTASEPKKRRTSATKTSSTSTSTSTSTSPPKETVAKESPTRNQKTEVARTAVDNTQGLFKGMQFFLTASGGGDPGISGNPGPTESYDKDDCKEVIEVAGGKILEFVGDEDREGKKVFLISDHYARTVKYIYCLAAGIPCISHGWIKTCLQKNEIVDWKVFTLPAGWSLEHQDLIKHHMKKPLKGCRVFVTSESDQLFNYWKPVLTAAEAVLLKPPKKKGQFIPTGTEVIVSDTPSETTDDVVVEANALNIPLVRPEWLVQTIITGEKAHMYGHDKYKVYYTETEESEETTGETGTEEGDPAYGESLLDQMQSPD